MPHLSSQFDLALSQLQSQLLQMGGLVESQLRRLSEALQQSQAVDLAEVQKIEQAINQAQVQIDQDGTLLIAKRQPTAVDLRLVLAVLHAVNDIERMGDELKKVATRLNACTVRPLPEQARLQQLLIAVSEVVALSLQSFAQGDLAQAKTVFKLDAVIDAGHENLTEIWMTLLSQDTALNKELLDLMTISKALERVGDHAKNIAEAVYSVVSGEDKRHLL
jgi:phosphate transport system protein